MKFQCAQTFKYHLEIHDTLYLLCPALRHRGHTCSIQCKYHEVSTQVFVSVCEALKIPTVSAKLPTTLSTV
jgi:hypothetical protein